MYKFPVAYFNSNNGIGRLAFGEGPMLKITGEKPLEQLQDFIDKYEGKHLLVNLSYDLKNHVEDLTSSNPDYLNFPLGYAWVPKYMVDLEHENLDFVQGEKDSEALRFIDHFMQEEIDENFQEFPHKLTPRITKEEYLKNVESLQSSIQQGDIYEVNYCQEFFAEDVDIPHQLDAYFKLNYLTRAPYSSFFFIDHFTTFCGSPERYLNRDNNRLISEPIKGTIKRGKTKEEDEAFKETLLNDPKNVLRT